MAPPARFRTVLVLLLVSALWPACRGTDPHAAGAGTKGGESSEPGPAVAYQCGDLRLEARFRDDAVALALPDRVLTLPLAVSASGARYADRHGNTFRTKGRTSGMLTLSGEASVACSVTAARSPWTQARERGVVYRAMGQEPGWVVEVGAGERPPMQAVLDYGERRLELPGSQTLNAASGFRGHAGGLMVELRIMHEACRDTMSGEPFETRAELRVNGALYRGCGRFLTP
jgi:putative lipoprotein